MGKSTKNMLGDPLVFSFLVDKSSSTCGFPWCAQGTQPKVTVPPFFPDSVKPFISQADAEAFFEEINRIMMETGCPPMPLMFIAMPIIIIIAILAVTTMNFIIVGIGMALAVLSFFFMMAVFM